MKTFEEMGLHRKKIGGLLSLVADALLPAGAQFEYFGSEYEITRVESDVVNNSCISTMIAECNRTGKFIFVLHRA